MFKPRSFGLFFCFVTFLACSLNFLPAFAEPIEGSYVPGEIIIKYSDTATGTEITTLSSQLNTITLRDFTRIGASLEQLTDMTVPEAIAQFENNPAVEYIEPNYLYFAEAIPNDPDFDKLWGMHNTGQTGGTVDADIDAPEAWNEFTGSGTVLVAVIDTGIDYTHPDLAANAWTNPGEIPGNGIDDDGNGFIDDVHGWDFVNNDNDPMDDNGHGTHCSGTIGGVGDNSLGVAGVNWNVKIMGLKFLSSSGGGSSADAVACIEYATMMGVDLTSNSWGGGSFSIALEEAIEDAYAADILFVAAAGNSGSNNDINPHYPSSYTTGNIVAVGATDHNDNIVNTGIWASSYGLTSVDIGAPGLDIYSTVPGGGYDYKSGTSMATPHVSGVLALVRGQFPGITADAAKALIFNSADVLPQLAGLWITGARINAAMALSGPDSIPPDPVVDLGVSETASNWMSLAWTATGDDGSTGNASSYDIRYAVFPIDDTNFDTALAVADPPFPAAPGQPDGVIVGGLDFLTTYYFALKIRDEYGNASPISNVAVGATLGIPVVSMTPGSLTASLITGEKQDQVLTISNVGAGTLDFTVSTIKTDPVALAMQAAAAAVVEGITPSGVSSLEGEGFPVLTADEAFLLRSRLASYGAANTNNPDGVLPVIGVGGSYSIDLIYFVLNNPQLTGLFVFQELNYESDDLSQIDGLMISESDNSITEAEAIVLKDFFDSGRGIMVGMDDFDSIWNGAIPGLLGPVFGITNPVDNDLCSNAVLNAAHPINDGITGFNINGNWCNENDSFDLDGADWLFMDGTQGNIFGVANESTARTVAMGETLAYVWEANEQLNANAVIWMMESGGIPSVDPVAGTIVAGGSMDITVTFDASDLCSGDFFAAVVLESNDPVDPEVLVPTVMTVTGEPDIDVSETLLDFGPVFIGAIVVDSLIVSNPGCDVIHVTNVAVDHIDFTTDLTPFDLAVGESRLMLVTHSPGGIGPVSGILSLTSNDPDQPLMEIALAADGLAAPVIGVSPASMATNLVTGEIDSQMLTITNTGGNDLVFDIFTEDLTANVQVSTGRVLNAAPAGDFSTAATQNGPAWDDGATPMRDPLPTPVNTVPGTNATDMALLIVGNGFPGEIQALLLAFSDISVVDIFDTGSGSPTLAELEPYHAVILSNSSPFMDPLGLGNVLADYVDQGGGVIQTIASFVDGFHFTGRFMDEGYSAFGLGVGPIGSGSLGIFDPSHPIMEGVTSVNGDLLATAPLTAGAQLVAAWDFGEAFVATQGDQVAGVNIFVAETGYWTGDVALILHNAAAWTSGSAQWLSVDPGNGAVAPGSSVDVLVTFDATGVCGGTYLGNVNVISNDPITPLVPVPVEMIVTGEPDIAVSDTLLAYGQQFIGAVVPDTLIISNPGCDLLRITTLTIDHTAFSADLSPFDLPVGEQRALEIFYSPTSTGPSAGTLVLTSNDPDTPQILVELIGEGLVAPDILVNPTQLFADLLTGEVETQTLTITNTGGNDLAWDIYPARRDSVAALLRAAAAEVVDGIAPSGLQEGDGISYAVLSDPEKTLLADRMNAYRQAVDDLVTDDTVPRVGVGGYSGYDLYWHLLNNVELTGMFFFEIVDFRSENLGHLDGLIIAEDDGYISETDAVILRNFHDSGRGIMLGMDDLNYVWSGNVPALLGPIFGIANPVDDNFCDDPQLNLSHPINAGVPPFVIGQYWCNDNDSFVTTTAEWLFMDGVTGNYFGVANDSSTRTVLMGENMAHMWLGNKELNANALIWMMRDSDLPRVDPTSGVLPAGGVQAIDVTFDATDLCGGFFPADLVLNSNAPVTPEILVPADMRVTGEPDIAVSDTLLSFGLVFVGATVADTVVITNPGCDVLMVRPFMAVRIEEAGFNIDTTHFELAAGESRDLVVTYSPTGPGSVTGEFTLASNDPDQPAVMVLLSGLGLLAPVVGVDPASLAVALLPGDIEVHQLTIANTGGSSLFWEIFRSRRDSTAMVMQAAAAAVVAGISPSSTVYLDGVPVSCLSDGEKALFEDRLGDYLMTASSFQGEDALPMVGVSGYNRADLMYKLLDNTELAGMYTFDFVAYESEDLTALDGLIIAERDAYLNVAGANILRDFSDSGRGIMMGMDDWKSIWPGGIDSILEPVFGFDFPIDSDFCGNPELNTAHPINDGIPSFIIGGYWCGDNDSFQMTSADWLFRDYSQNRIYGAANKGTARTVAMGETLSGIWTTNEQLNVNALIWVMESSSLPGVNPIAGMIQPGGTQVVDVTFDATGITGGEFLSNLTVVSNDPVNPEVVVPADMTVRSAPMSVIVSLTVAGASDMDNTLGINEGATDGFDGQFDMPEPPHAPADYVAGYFHHPEWGSPLGDRYMTDIRAPYNPGLEMKSWPFVVETDLGDSTVTMVFTPSFPESSGWQLWLRDDATGAMANLFPSLTYQFRPGAGSGAHPFTIYVGKILPPLYPAERQIATGWFMLGAPLVPAAGSDTWDDVLLDDTSGTTFMFDYEGATGYGDVAAADPVVQGQGVWLASTDNFTWSMEGEPDEGTIDVPTMTGWNLIGYPIWFEGGLDGVSVEHSGQQYLWSDAVAAGLVSPFVYDYDGMTDNYLPVSALAPWRGYWMAAHVSEVTIQFNYRSMLSAPVPVAGDPGQDVSRLPMLVQAAPSGNKDKSGDQGWQFNVNLAQGGDEVAIGRALDATAGFDAAFDLPVPPNSPSSTARATLVIRHPEWNLACGSGFFSDLVSMSGEPQEWNLTVTVPEPERVTLHWDSLGLPAEVDLQVYLPHENRVVVMSVRGETSLQVDVGTEPLVVQFRTSNGISDVPGQLAGLQLRNAPNPFNPMTEFRFNLPRAGETEIRIYDVRGAVVRRVSGGVMAAGPAKLQWAGRDGHGRDVASGIYFYRLYLEGRQEGKTLKMTLLK